MSQFPLGRTIAQLEALSPLDRFIFDYYYNILKAGGTAEVTVYHHRKLLEKAEKSSHTLHLILLNIHCQIFYRKGAKMVTLAKAAINSGADVLKQGEVIYLDPKRSRAKKGYNVYVCPEEMTLREVSQHEGIKLKKLMQYNMSEQPDEVLPTGTKVILR